MDKDKIKQIEEALGKNKNGLLPCIRCGSESIVLKTCGHKPWFQCTDCLQQGDTADNVDDAKGRWNIQRLPHLRTLLDLNNRLQGELDDMNADWDTHNNELCVNISELEKELDGERQKSHEIAWDCAKEIDSLQGELDRKNKALTDKDKAIGFARSMILGGESMTDTAEAFLASALTLPITSPPVCTCSSEKFVPCELHPSWDGTKENMPAVPLPNNKPVCEKKEKFCLIPRGMDNNWFRFCDTTPAHDECKPCKHHISNKSVCEKCGGSGTSFRCDSCSVTGQECIDCVETSGKPCDCQKQTKGKGQDSE